MAHLGAHMSIAGGVQNAVFHGQRVGCTAIQLFTKSNRQLSAKPLSAEEADLFKKAVQDTGVAAPLAHAAYLINLASPKEDLWKLSFDSMANEVLRAGQLEIAYLVLHPGSHTGTGAPEGIKRIARAINLINGDRSRGLVPKGPVPNSPSSPNPMILFECMAGQGSSIGSKFEELAEILSLIEDQSRVGICLDTCHLFAAGYDIRTEASFSHVLASFDKIIGLDRVKAFHLNDSKKELGSHVDRHEHIGKGHIGVEAFRYLLNDPRFLKVPMVLETPKDEKDEFDLMNLGTLRGLMAERVS